MKSRKDSVVDAGGERVIDAAAMTERRRFEERMLPEARVSGFSHLDQEVGFFVHVDALIEPTDILLDFGAGRGEFMSNDPSLYRRRLQNFKGRVAHVDGCDLDPVVLQNPTLDDAKLFEPGEPLPYEDDRFDIIVSRYVFEHIPDPEWAANELMRILKPGGWLCVITPNKWGYVAIAASLIPNRLHTRVLHKVQQSRKDEDVFPTEYKLNTPGAVRRHFGDMADVYHYSTSGVPSYHFGSPFLFRLFRLWHRLAPPMLDTGLRFFIQKHRT